VIKEKANRRNAETNLTIKRGVMSSRLEWIAPDSHKMKVKSSRNGI
jgi:hypothetical protein